MISLYLPVFKLASDSVMGATRKHETPESGTKDFIIHGKSNSQSFMLVCVNSPIPRAPQGLKWAYEGSLCRKGTLHWGSS